MAPYRLDGAASPAVVEIGGGGVVLGADPSAGDFGWDNEFPQLEVSVGDFGMDRTPVRNAEFREFVADGGYARAELWGDDDWRWRERIGLELPVFWSRDNGSLTYDTLFDRLDLRRLAGLCKPRRGPSLLSLARRAAAHRGRVSPRRLHNSER
jgi:iron(II)-dependent oxidoreductase